MKKALCILAAVALFANAASAQIISTVGPTYTQKTPSTGVNYAIDGIEAGLICNFATTNVPSFDGVGDVSNVVVNLDVAACVGLPSGTAMSMNGVGWDVTLFADPAVGTFGGSWLSELTVGWSAGGDPTPDIQLAPGAGDDFPGTSTYANPVIKFNTIPNLPDIVLPNGMLRMEFFEGFDDAGNVADGRWNSGVLQIQVTPEPATLGILAIGALALIRRRR